MKIAFYKAFQPRATWLDRTIAIATFGKYSHVELIFSDGMAFSISWRDKGARFKYIDFDVNSWDIYSLNVTRQEEVAVRNMAHTFKDVGYDFKGALCSIFAVCIHKKDKVFCSEVITNLLRMSHQYGYLKRGCRYSPSRLGKEFKSE